MQESEIVKRPFCLTEFFNCQDTDTQVELQLTYIAITLIAPVRTKQVNLSFVTQTTTNFCDRKKPDWFLFDSRYCDHSSKFCNQVIREDRSVTVNEDWTWRMSLLYTMLLLGCCRCCNNCLFVVHVVSGLHFISLIKVYSLSSRVISM